MCARKLGRIKEAVKMMRDVSFLCPFKIDSKTSKRHLIGILL